MAIHAEVDAAFPWDFDAPFRSPKAARSTRVREVEAGCNISRPFLQDSPKQVDQALWDFVNAELQALGITKPNYDIQWAEMNNCQRNTGSCGSKWGVATQPASAEEYLVESRPKNYSSLHFSFQKQDIFQKSK